MTALLERQGLVEMVKTAQASGARLHSACAEVGVSVRTYQRWIDGKYSPPGIAHTVNTTLRALSGLMPKRTGR
ncbi:hypothetical protein Lcho_1036 [Leptothrix cholodnii SP-6]|uniref:Uncharacterized protein n=1 Tax=Leptothrix cholodnii (strain ATCC 51168 / LMG 8142 / SP-6) TaxID=395495 RepID=B1Y3A4_LEPCP|nr:hypothetical protein [Leptothrix cholodnii]ACB33307.1 hypothetical protein Lcho_1036 [Leptothrix cholodnii SP-6]